MKSLVYALILLLASAHGTELRALKKSTKSSKSKDGVQYGSRALLFASGASQRNMALGFHGNGLDGDPACVSSTECGEFAYRTDFHLEFADMSGDCLEIHRSNNEICRHQCDPNEPGQFWYFIQAPNSRSNEFFVYNPDTGRVLEYSSRSSNNHLKVEDLDDLPEDEDVLFQVRQRGFFNCNRDEC